MKSTAILHLARLALLLVLAGPAGADVVVLDDGREIEGIVLEANSKEVVLDTGLAKLTFPRSKVVDIVYKKTREQIYEEKLAASETADDFHALALWCRENGMRVKAKKLFERAIEVDSQHAASRKELGHVLYQGEWMTPEERDRRQAADREAEMHARGLVRWKDRWVTPDEKDKLERGLVQYEGRWMTLEESMRLQGYLPHGDGWIARSEAVARRRADAAGKAAGMPFQVVADDVALIGGPVPMTALELLSKGARTGRQAFDALYGVEPGLGLFGGDLPELYVFGVADAPYLATLEEFAATTDTLYEGWSQAARNAHGYFWVDPYPLSVARQWHRGEQDLYGHTYHHWGHLLVGSLDYDGRLLPVWYEEALAALIEFRVHGLNRVFCRSNLMSSGGTSAGRREGDMDPARMRDGEWRAFLLDGLATGTVLAFDKLAQLELHNLEMIDVAAGMGILEWVEQRGEAALGRFHDELRKGAPPAPERNLLEGTKRQAVYDAAFRAATGMGFHEADQEWRQWFRTR